MIDRWYLQNVKDLAPKRYESLVLLAAGYSYDEISTLREVSYTTTRNLFSRFRTKVGAKNDAHLVKLACQEGIL